MLRGIVLQAAVHVPWAIRSSKCVRATAAACQLLPLGCQPSVARVTAPTVGLYTTLSGWQGYNRSNWAYAATLLAAGGCLTGLAWGIQPAEARQVASGAGAPKGQDTSSSKAAHQQQPVYTPEEVAKHRTPESRVWVTFKDGVYDITDFIAQHPGGAQKIMLAGESQRMP